MIRKTIKPLVVSMIFISICGVARSQALGAANVGEIVNAYKDNQARFVARYRGKQFSSQTTFDGASENIFVRGSFLAKFAVNGQEINCSFSRSDEVNRLMDLNRGDKVYLEGIIDDVTMGDVQLKSCKFKK